MADWNSLLPLEELPLGSLKALKAGPHQLVLARTEEGEVHALDNRCPHEGYPLATGTLKGCDLTCCWHNWKFDVRDGACRVGGEGVRSFPSRVVDGSIEVDLADPDPSAFFPAWLESLHEGIHKHENGRAVRDVVRLLQGGYDPWKILAEIARDDADRAEYGSSHTLAVAADCGRVLERYPGVKAAYAIAPVLDLCGESHKLRPLRERPAPIAGATEAALREAVENEDAARAEALVLGAFEAGVDRMTIESWMLAALSDHFLDFGHQLIYLTKAQDLFAKAGDEHAPAILGSLVYSIVYGTREDTLPYMDAYAKRMDELPRREVDPNAELDADAFRASILDAQRGSEAMQALIDALDRGVAPGILGRELMFASAERLLRFDPSLEARGDVAENWLWGTHRFTFSAAASLVVGCWPHPDAVRLLGQMVMFIHSGRAMDGARPSTEPAEGDPLEAALAGDAELAVRRAMNPSLDLTGVKERLEDWVLTDPVVRPIVVAHAIKTPFAAFEMAEEYEGHPLARLPLAASLRFLASPLKERRVHQIVTTSIEWVVDGKVPKKLTQ